MPTINQRCSWVGIASGWFDHVGTTKIPPWLLIRASFNSIWPLAGGKTMSEPWHIYQADAFFSWPPSLHVCYHHSQSWLTSQVLIMMTYLGKAHCPFWALMPLLTWCDIQSYIFILWYLTTLSNNSTHDLQWVFLKIWFNVPSIS